MQKKNSTGYARAAAIIMAKKSLALKSSPVIPNLGMR